MFLSFVCCPMAPCAATCHRAWVTHSLWMICFQVSKGTRSGSASVTRYMTQGAVPPTTIAARSPSLLLFGKHYIADQLQIVVDNDGLIDNSYYSLANITSWKWTAGFVRNQTLILTPLTASNLVLAPFALSPDAQYDFRVDFNTSGERP